MATLNTGFPQAVFLDASGEISPVWRAFLLSLFNRTGASIGIDSAQPALKAAIAAEVSNRIAAIASVQTAVSLETANRVLGDAANASAIASLAASAARTFYYRQDTATTVWVIPHNLNTFPSVVVADSAGSLIEGDVSYDSPVQTTLTFSAAFAGVAYLI